MKLKVKDSKGRILRVSDDCDMQDADEKEEELSKADVKKLKKLLPHLDDLLQLLEIEEQEHDKDFAGDEIDSDMDIDVEEKEEKKDEKVEDDADIEAEADDYEEEADEDFTQKVKPVHDSKKSFGACERRKVTDSVDTDIEQDNEIALAWAKRYNGGN